MSEISIKSKDGKDVGKHKLGKAISEREITANSLHRVIVAEEANARQGTQSAKTRSEARGGGRKPYKQKKTGNARQGTIRAPHYAHGGMALAVKPRDYTKKVNRKERRAAILGALKLRADEGAVILVDTFGFSTPKTKDAQAVLNNLELGETRRVLVITDKHDPIILKSFRNLPNVEVRTAPSKGEAGTVFSTRDLMVAHKIVVTKDAMVAIEEYWS